MAYTFPPDLKKIADSVPADIRKRLSTAELLARCLRVKEIEGRAAAMALPRDYQLLSGLADRTLRALPAAEFAAEVDTLLTKAAAAQDRYLAVGYRQRADELRQANPVVDEQAVAAAARIVKAADVRRSTPRPVHLGDGRMLYKGVAQ